MLKIVKSTKREPLWRIRECEECGRRFVLGPLDPDMDMCPLCFWRSKR